MGKMVDYRKFWDYVIISEDGELLGLKDPSPEEAIKEYELYLKEIEEAQKNLIKL